MATRSVIARPHPTRGFIGRYVHYDGHPATRIPALRHLHLLIHHGDTEAAIRQLVDEHTGWSSIPHYKRPTGECYCHSRTLRQDTGPVYGDDSAGHGLEWAYVLEAETIRVLRPGDDGKGGSTWHLDSLFTWNTRAI
ncbi:hypothetical protein GCM10020367_20560 [Streptomyces sannanensis]|uniref:Uncharacterized protein n=1 Tax=Streptomyces sannanensis TaxID=285536 RepID=A0ABP6S932_9ACTN